MSIAVRPYAAPTLVGAHAARVRQDDMLEPQNATVKAFTVGKAQLLQEARHLNLLLLTAALVALVAVVLIAVLLRSGSPESSAKGFPSLTEQALPFGEGATGQPFQTFEPLER